MQVAKLEAINRDRAALGRRIQTSLEPQQMDEIKTKWAWFVKYFITARAHVILNGRIGDVWEYVEDPDTGKMEMMATGHKMDGEKAINYEPNLVIELRKRRNPKATAGSNRASAEIITGYVLKDRANRIHGHVLDWPKFSQIRPHLEFLGLKPGVDPGGVKFAENSGADEFSGDEVNTGWTKERQDRTIYWENVKGELEDWYPGQTAEAKTARRELLWLVFRTRSETELATNIPACELANGLEKIRELRYPKPPDNDAIPGL
jgi:hypothetical protein